jgi:hypothetical protein
MKTLTRRRPQAPATPVATFTQDELRQRRRHWLPVIYRSDFDLAAEVAAIVGPLARAVSRIPRPEALHRDVYDVTDAVHELLSTVVGMLAESKQLDRAAKVRTARGVADLAQRPHEPRVTADMLTSGHWAALMVDHVAPYTADVAALLGRSPAASGRLEAALRVLDSAALDLQRRVPKVAAHQALPSMEAFNATKRAQRDAERRRAALAKMGIEETP